jgi:hypothetical protein
MVEAAGRRVVTWMGARAGCEAPPIRVIKRTPRGEALSRVRLDARVGDVVKTTQTHVDLSDRGVYVFFVVAVTHSLTSTYVCRLDMVRARA